MIAVELTKTCIVECLNIDCENHLESRGCFHCNAKTIMINKEGKCMKYIKLRQISNSRTYMEDIKKSIKNTNI